MKMCLARGQGVQSTTVAAGQSTPRWHYVSAAGEQRENVSGQLTTAKMALDSCLRQPAKSGI
ncbi:hypothetical protein HPP92_027022 [Vanilla planifolia]|uniref:Uncharacterized protein n=1 Tax=Vanilla planifolia TaxID=51239 RepID=A0A835PD21_VANPL|nr:hypothetical protein HPP92_027022 [Vanilla planifolia]